MDLVDEQDGIGLVLERLEHALQTLLEVAAVLGAGQQRAHVQRIDIGLGQDLGHLLLDDAPGQALGNRSLADTGFAHQQRIVLAPAAQDLDHALDFVFATDQRIDLAFLGRLVQVLGVLLQRRSLAVALLGGGSALVGLTRPVAGLAGLGRVAFLDAVGDEVDHVQARHALLVQVIDGVRILLAEDGHQHIGARDFLLAAAGGLHVHDGALDHALEAQRGLGIDVVAAGHLRGVVLDEVGQRLAQVVDIGGAGAQHLGRAGIVEQGQQQMLHGDEFMALLSRLDKRHVQADFQFLGNHVTSFCLAYKLTLIRFTQQANSSGRERKVTFPRRPKFFSPSHPTPPARRRTAADARPCAPPPAPGRPWWRQHPWYRRHRPLCRPGGSSA
jgi:hypothetical protein